MQTTLNLQILSASKLPNIGLDRPPSSYISFTHNSKFLFTDIKPLQSNPQFHSTFKLQSPVQPSPPLTFTVYNSNKTDIDQTLGTFTVPFSELMTNKPTTSEYTLDNRVSVVRVRHWVENAKNEKYAVTARTYVAVRVVDVREDVSENGMLVVTGQGNSVQMKVKKGDPVLPAVTFKYPVAGTELEISYESYDDENRATLMGTKVLDLENIDAKEGSFVTLTYANKQNLQQKVVTLSLILIENISPTNIYNSIVVELTNTNYKDYTMRIVSCLDEDFITDSKKATKKLFCEPNSGILTLQYYKNIRNVKGLSNNKADSTQVISLSEINWQDKGTHMLMKRQLTFSSMTMPNTIVDINLRLMKLQGKQQEQSKYTTALPSIDTSLKRSVKFKISRIELKKCFLFEILEKGQMYWMVKDSEQTLSFTSITSDKDYIWQCAIPAIASNRTQHVVSMILLDRNVNFGQTQLSQLENSQILKVNLSIDSMTSPTGQIKIQRADSIIYFQQFLKYAKKYSLVNPQNTKNFNTMVNFNPIQVKIIYQNFEVCEYGQACINIVNARFVKQKQDLSLKSLQLALDGNCITVGPATQNSFMMVNSQPLYVRSMQHSQARVTVYLEEHNKNNVVYNCSTTISQLLPIAGKRSKVSLPIAPDESLVIYYTSTMEQPFTPPLLTSNYRVTMPKALLYRVRLYEMTLEGNCEYFTIECESISKKYRSLKYYLQTNSVKLDKREHFYVQFNDVQSEKKQEKSQKPEKKDKAQLLFISCHIKRKSTSGQVTNDLYNGFIDLCKIYSNTRPSLHTVTLSKSNTDKSLKNHLTLIVEPKVCPIFKTPSLPISLNLKLRYVIEFETDRLLRQTTSYFIKFIFGKLEKYVKCSLQKDQILDVTNLCMTMNTSKYYSSMKDNKYSLYLKTVSQVNIPTTAEDLSEVYIELYSFPKDKSLEQILQQSTNLQCNKIAEGSKPILEILEQTKGNYCQTIQLLSCTPPATSFRLSDTGILLQQMSTNIHLLYIPKIVKPTEQIAIRRKPQHAIPVELLSKAVLLVTIDGVNNYQRNRVSNQGTFFLRGKDEKERLGAAMRGSFQREVMGRVESPLKKLEKSDVVVSPVKELQKQKEVPSKAPIDPWLNTNPWSNPPTSLAPADPYSNTNPWSDPNNPRPPQLNQSSLSQYTPQLQPSSTAPKPPAPGHPLLPSSLHLLPTTFSVRNSDFTTCVQRIFECNDQFDLQQYIHTVSVNKLSFKSNQTMEGMLELCEKGDGLVRDQLKMKVRMVSNRFTENCEGTMRVSHLSLEVEKEVEGRLANAELQLFFVMDYLRLMEIDTQLLVESYPAKNLIWRYQMPSKIPSGNLLNKQMPINTNYFRNSLLLTLSEKKNTYASLVVELMSLPLEKLEQDGFQVILPITIKVDTKSTTGKIKIAGNYVSHLLEMRASTRRIKEAQEIKYRMCDQEGQEVTVEYAQDTINQPDIQSYQELETSRQAKRQFLKLKIPSPQQLSFSKFMDKISIYFISNNKKQYLISCQHYTVKHQPNKTVITFDSDYTQIVDSLVIDKMRIDYFDFDGDLLSLSTYLLKQKSLYRYVFESTYQQLCVTLLPLQLPSIPPNTTFHIRLHRLVSLPPRTTSLAIGKTVLPLVHLTTEPNADSILTKKYRVLGYANSQYKTSYEVDNQGKFAAETEMEFGVGGGMEQEEVRFDLMIDNMFNRQGVENQGEGEDWMKRMVIARGKLHIPELMDGQTKKYFGCRLKGFRIDAVGMNRAFLNLLDKENLCLLGSAQLKRCRWGFITISVKQLNNFILLQPPNKCLISLQLTIIKQQGSSKQVLRDFKTPLFPISPTSTTIPFPSFCSFTEHLTLQSHHYLQILVTIHSIPSTLTLCQKRLTITDSSYQNQPITIQIKDCPKLKSVSELKLCINRTTSKPKETKKQQTVSKIDVVDFRTKRDVELVEILMMTGRVTQLVETLEEVKESLIYGEGERGELLRMLLVIMRVYKQVVAVLRLTIESVMVYLVKAPKPLGEEEQVTIYEAVKEVMREEDEEKVQLGGVSLTAKEILVSKDWKQLELEIRKTKAANADKQTIDPYSMRLQLSLQFLLFLLKKYPLLTQTTLTSLPHWLSLSQSSSSTVKSRSLFQSLFQFLFPDPSQIPPQHLSSIFNYFLVNGGKQTYLYSIYTRVKGDEICAGQYIGHFKEQLQRPLSGEVCEVVEMVVEEMADREREREKEKGENGIDRGLVEDITKAIFREFKGCVADSATTNNILLLKKMLNILNLILKNIQPDSPFKKEILDYCHDKQKTAKGDKKVLLSGFLKKTEGFQMHAQPKASAGKKLLENRFLISRLDY